MGIQMNANGSSGSADKVGLQWPADGLESVPNCPVCGSDSRELLHEGLTDRIFFCAPGEWSMYRCESCASAYLDPRPNSDTIGLAYQNYFTHSETPGFSSLSFPGKLRRMLGNGYRNHRYGTRDYPSSVFGILAANFIPNRRAIIDAGMRHLPNPSVGQRLLDVGCGSGEFLNRARSCGWEVVGVEIDPKAVEVCRRHGIDVRAGSIDSLDIRRERFDGITIRHVIEHLHDPIAMLAICHKLLKPEGWIWIETPNINSQGYRFYGVNWRDLDPPRHLILFNHSSLRNALERADFDNVQDQPWRPICSEVFPASEAIANGLDPIDQAVSLDVMSKVRACDRLAKYDPRIREFITVKAWKK